MRKQLQFLKARVAEAEVKKKVRENNSYPQAATEFEQLQKEKYQAEQRGLSNISTRRIAHAQSELDKAIQLNLFAGYPITQTNQVPTLLARIPVFVPLRVEEQKKLLDKDFALAFETPFGRGRRFGPAVTMYDEDVLFALMRLRSRKLVGKGSKLPIPVNGYNYLRDSQGDLQVYWVCCTVSDILHEMGISDGGVNYRDTVASIKRLNAITIELETRKTARYFGESYAGGAIRLIDCQWELFKEQGLIKAQFSPIIAKWLDESFTYLDWEIRRALRGANAKALHRFLSTQPSGYKAPIDYIADVIMWQGNPSRRRPGFEKVMKTLRDSHHWCDYDITGTGRKTPFVLQFWRL